MTQGLFSLRTEPNIDWDISKLEDWLSDIEMAADILGRVMHT